LSNQPKDEQDTFWAWIKSGNNKLVLLEACQSEGLNVSSSSFYRHLNGRCDCEAEI
jgi:hypothetical protein